MDINKFTIKSQEALQSAQAIATRYNHQEIDGEHLFLALLEQDNGLVPKIIEKVGAPVIQIKERVVQELEKKPRVTGPGTEAGKIYITQRLNKILLKAQDEAKNLKDEYVSVEHILLAFADEDSSTFVGKILKEFGITRETILNVLIEVRGHQRVTSPEPEATYEALKKYGRDLVEEARSGKLDPVIGRDSEIRRVIRILSRKTKNNPVLIGEQRKGKTPIVEGIAHRNVRGNVP